MTRAGHGPIGSKPPGAVGQYKDRAVWQRMGLVREPGRVLEIRTTDPVLAT